MKGIIFTVLNKMVEEKFGLQAWDDLIQESNLSSGGVFTSAKTYPDSDLFALVGAISSKTGVAVPELVQSFGKYTLHELAKAYPQFFKGKTLKPFLKSVHSIIHVEVLKLHPGAELPTIEYEEPAEKSLVMLYRSKRKMCHLAHGLIEGSAEHFGSKITKRETQCLHRGDDHCRIEIEFNDS